MDLIAEALLFLLALVAEFAGWHRLSTGVLALSLASIMLKYRRERRNRKRLEQEVREITALLNRAWLTWR